MIMKASGALHHKTLFERCINNAQVNSSQFFFIFKTYTESFFGKSDNTFKGFHLLPIVFTREDQGRYGGGMEVGQYMKAVGCIDGSVKIGRQPMV